jgi:hypothetical protein
MKRFSSRFNGLGSYLNRTREDQEGRQWKEGNGACAGSALWGVPAIPDSPLKSLFTWVGDDDGVAGILVDNNSVESSCHWASRRSRSAGARAARQTHSGRSTGTGRPADRSAGRSALQR